MEKEGSGNASERHCLRERRQVQTQAKGSAATCAGPARRVRAVPARRIRAPGLDLRPCEGVQPARPLRQPEATAVLQRPPPTVRIRRRGGGRRRRHAGRPGPDGAVDDERLPNPDHQLGGPEVLGHLAAREDGRLERREHVLVRDGRSGRAAAGGLGSSRGELATPELERVWGAHRLREHPLEPVRYRVRKAVLPQEGRRCRAVAQRRVLLSRHPSTLGQLGRQPHLVHVAIAEDEVHPVRVPSPERQQLPHEPQLAVPAVEGVPA